MSYKASVKLRFRSALFYFMSSEEQTRCVFKEFSLFHYKSYVAGAH